MFLEQALRNHLVANTALVAQVGTRIYPNQLPQGATLPAVVYSKVDGIPEYSHDGAGEAITSRIQLDCLALTYSEVKTLSANVKRAMRPLEQTPAVRGGAGGLHIASAELESEVGPMSEVNEVDHISREIAILDYLVQHEIDY